MKRVVAIIGLMRSGTSMVAQVVHRLGFYVAVTIPAPAPPSWRSDWEDVELTAQLIRRERVDWPAYMAWRTKAAHRLGFEGIAVKSPYLALAWKGFRKEVSDPYIIRVRRSLPDIERSMAAHPSLSQEDQKSIASVLGTIQPTHTIQYESMVERPLSLVAGLGRELGASEDDICGAATLVQRPTEYAKCLQ